MNKTVQLTFEVGKSYRTRKGDVVKIVQRTTSPYYPLQGPHRNQSWTLDGRYWTTAKMECSADLMPGAVEDEPEDVDPICVLQGQIDKLNERISGIVHREADWADATWRVSKLEKKLEHTLSATKHQQDAIKSVISAAKDQQSVIANHSERLMNLQDRINIIEQFCRINPRPEPASLPSERIKRTIKGGWVNFYPEGGWEPSVHRTRDKADASAGAARIACIQIPDITVGEGL